jgi:hypothetical protein
MKSTRSQASKRLFKKLSALRATLSNEERAILDGMIVGDVEAHRMTSKSVGKAAGKSANKAAEVEAHRMTSKSVGKSVSKSTSKSANKSTARITFDPNSEEYRIQD